MLGWTQHDITVHRALVDLEAGLDRQRPAPEAGARSGRLARTALARLRRSRCVGGLRVARFFTEQGAESGPLVDRFLFLGVGCPKTFQPTAYVFAHREFPSEDSTMKVAALSTQIDLNRGRLTPQRRSSLGAGQNPTRVE